MNELVQQRDISIDNAKGFAAIIVVIGHFIEMTIFNNPRLGYSLDFVCYSLHVPTFLFCSGFLFRYTYMHRHSIKCIIITKLVDNMLVWAVWGTMLLLSNYLVDRYLFGEIYPLIECVKYSFNQLWYLGFLFLCYLVTLVISKFNMPKKVFLCLLIMLVCIFAFINVSIDKLLVHYLMFSIGFLIDISRLKKIRWILYGYIILMLSALILGINISTLFDTWQSTLFAFLVKVIGSLVLYTFFSARLNVGRNYLFSSLGGSTLYIYIFHFFVLAIYRRLYNESFLVMIFFIIIAILFSVSIKKIIEIFDIEYIIQPSLLQKKKGNQTL